MVSHRSNKTIGSSLIVHAAIMQSCAMCILMIAPLTFWLRLYISMCSSNTDQCTCAEGFAMVLVGLGGQLLIMWLVSQVGKWVV
jgi:hypothetical protein